MKNNILKMINEKYEKYSIGYSKIKCPKFEDIEMRNSFFGRCPIFFGQNRSSPPPKKWPVRLWLNPAISTTHRPSYPDHAMRK